MNSENGELSGRSKKAVMNKVVKKQKKLGHPRYKMKYIEKINTLKISKKRVRHIVHELSYN